jgi:hypothetical protein
MPMYSLFDTYTDFAFPGGIHLSCSPKSGSRATTR